MQCPQARTESSWRQSSFHTPRKLNHVETKEAEQLCENRQEENESTSELEAEVDQLCVHEEQAESEDQAMLLALRQFDKFKRTDGQP